MTHHVDCRRESVALLGKMKAGRMDGQDLVGEKEGK
jgi:hypothetical protein